MKKVLMIAAVMVGLTGCYDNDYEATRDVVTPIEDTILDATITQKQDNQYSYDFHRIDGRSIFYRETAKALRKQRHVHPENIDCTHIKAGSIPDLTEYPLCDVYSHVMKDQEIWAMQHPDQKPMTILTDIYQDTYGMTMAQACGFAERTSSPVVVKQAVEVVSLAAKDTIKGEDTDALTSEMYDKLIESAKTCNRSKNKLLGLTENKEYLTGTDYQDVMSVVMKCKLFELEKELNNQLTSLMESEIMAP